MRSGLSESFWSLGGAEPKSVVESERLVCDIGDGDVGLIDICDGIVDSSKVSRSDIGAVEEGREICRLR